MNRLLTLSLLVILLGGLAAGAGEGFYINGSEPAFLEDVGPREPRTDNPAAAGVTAVVVAAVILRGIWSYSGDS
ncbi:MAG: hypothetical protein ABEJ62_02525 [Candidatus Nanohaloarchaea archaeon]